MTKTITYKDISDSVKLEASNLMLKVEAVESLLANHQTEKAPLNYLIEKQNNFYLQKKIIYSNK